MKITKTQLKEMIQKTIKEQINKTVNERKKSLKENSMVFGMAKPSKMPNPFERSRMSGGANSRLNEMILRTKLNEAQEYMEYVEELLGDASKLAMVTESDTKVKRTTRTVETLEEQAKQMNKIIKKLLGG